MTRSSNIHIHGHGRTHRWEVLLYPPKTKMRVSSIAVAVCFQRGSGPCALPAAPPGPTPALVPRAPMPMPVLALPPPPDSTEEGDGGNPGPPAAVAAPKEGAAEVEAGGETRAQ